MNFLMSKNLDLHERYATIDTQILARNKLGLLTGEVKHCFRNILWGSKTLHGNSCLVSILFLLRGSFVPFYGNPPWSDRIYC